MHLEGGLAEASFQPVGYSRPNSYCSGESFQPPSNDQSRITYLNFGNSLTNKAVWGTTEITRAVVTYQISAKVSKSTAYVKAKGNKLVVPNLLTIDRTSPRGSTNQRKSLKDTDINKEHRDLESYFDSTLGVIVMNRTTLPANSCQRYRSIADISEASLFKKYFYHGCCHSFTCCPTGC